MILAAALAAGVLLRFVVGLQPVAWLAWLAPALLLAAVLRAPGNSWRWFSFAAVLIAYQANAAYYFRVMPVWAALLVIAGQALLWRLVLTETRLVVLRIRRAWTVIAYPVFWVAVDTLLAAFFPDGNWASLAYTQAEVLPLMQVASLFGVAGVLFLLCLGASALALPAVLGLGDSGLRVAQTGTVVMLAGAFVFGTMRMDNPPEPARSRVSVGLAAVDDAIGLEAKMPYVAAIESAYAAHIAALSASGARLVLLPEKIAVASEANVRWWQERLAASAGQHRVWLLAGVAGKTAQGVMNDAWLFSPGGALAASYRKHFMAPPERRGYVSGSEYVLHDIEGARFGIAICKDMHFATLGRENGRRGAAVMLVPAWDFSADAWMGARMTAVRGIENGYAVVRAAREGLLTVTDAYGRVLAERPSAALPGQRLQTSLPLRAQIPTLYTKTGNVLGWICVGAAAFLMWFARRRPAVPPPAV